ncbi:hypothetical protein PsYK624_108810 [Phanerochaete sordida]|uniref:Microbial-type PARG catalytic domain-containing protein n=1 Tax=Phanerochaete sordida TaxID=48140 RepID=A0A9P3GJG1_9APHY|nr:hypothetical protein PsYK624_108810 [Phanerochaete sordida]
MFDLKGPLATATTNTRFYGHDAHTLLRWKAVPGPERGARLSPSLLAVSTLEGSRYLAAELAGATPRPRIGVLNFASATKPGGGFINGAQAQEESIARSSTLYPTLKTKQAEQFYQLHKRDQKAGFYSHAIIYSPDVVVFRDDEGNWPPPLTVDVLTSAAVNAGQVRQKFGSLVDEKKIEKDMRERMGRILYLFERRGVRHIVLGSFGTGVFQNNIELVANIWADLLFEKDSRFLRSFDRVVFAVLGDETFQTFEEVFSVRYPPARS